MTEEKPHRYLVTYQLKHHTKGVLTQDVPTMHGASDILIVISQLLLGEDRSQSVSGLDGRTGNDVSQGEIWIAWMQLARSLATEDNNLDPRQKLCAWSAFSLASQMIFGQVPPPPPELAAAAAQLDGLVGYRRNPEPRS